MITQALPWLISAAAIASVVLAGWLKHWSGWLVLMAQHIVFTVWTVLGGYPGFLPMNIGMFVSAAISLYLWRRGRDRNRLAVARREKQKRAIHAVMDQYWDAYLGDIANTPWPNDPDGGEGRLAGAVARVATVAADGTTSQVLDYLEIALVSTARQRLAAGEPLAGIDLDGKPQVFDAEALWLPDAGERQ